MDIVDHCPAGRFNHDPVVTSWQRQPDLNLKSPSTLCSPRCDASSWESLEEKQPHSITAPPPYSGPVGIRFCCITILLFLWWSQASFLSHLTIVPGSSPSSKSHLVERFISLTSASLCVPSGATVDMSFITYVTQLFFFYSRCPIYERQHTSVSFHLYILESSTDSLREFDSVRLRVTSYLYPIETGSRGWPLNREFKMAAKWSNRKAFALSLGDHEFESQKCQVHENHTHFR